MKCDIAVDANCLVLHVVPFIYHTTQEAKVFGQKNNICKTVLYCAECDNMKYMTYIVSPLGNDNLETPTYYFMGKCSTSHM